MMRVARWYNNRDVRMEEMPVPQIGPSELLMRVHASGICGSDVHMYQTDEDGYIYYPGLTAFPCTLGHEFAGTVVEVGERAMNKRTGKMYEPGEPVCSEEMMWCAQCRPCADGWEEG